MDQAKIDRINARDKAMREEFLRKQKNEETEVPRDSFDDADNAFEPDVVDDEQYESDSESDEEEKEEE